MDAGVLPVKTLAEAKQRLGPHFDPAARAAVAQALLDDALDLCAGTPIVEWWVVSPDPEVLALARGRGLRALADCGTGLNDALRMALEEVGPVARSVTIVPTDLPHAIPEDILDIVETGATSDLVVVPARRDGGTNALHMRPPGLLEPRFGAGSLQAHVDLAERRKLRCSILSLGRLALDLDTPDDVDELLSTPNDGRSSRLLALLRAARS